MSDLKPAYQGELMLAGWGENHTGGAKVTFWLPDAEALDAFRHLTVRKGNTAGQRFMCVFVQIGEDEKPVAGDMPAGGSLCKSAALLCQSDDFQRFVESQCGYTLADQAKRADMAADYVRVECGIKSRRELDSNKAASQSFQQLMADYRAWLNPV